MIIYGSRMYGRRNRVRSHGRCGHCGKLGQQESYEGRKWGHLYFIPLFPIGPHVRVLRECSSCSTGAHIPREKLPELAKSLRDMIDRATIAAGSKEPSVEVDGCPVPVVSVISSVVGDAYCLLGEKELALLLENLRSVEAGDVLLLAEAMAKNLTGKPREAEAIFRELTSRSTDAGILFQAARFHFDHGRMAETAALAERVESMRATDLDVKQLLIECYGSLGDWTKLAATYENCFLIAPELKAQKEILKAYTKACKKAGREPQHAV